MQKQAINIYERIVLESILSCEKTFSQLCSDLELPQIIIQNALNSLVIKNYIKLSRGKYFCKLNSFEIQHFINDPESVKLEINLIQKQALKQTIDHNKNYLKLRKVYLSKHDKIVLKSILANLEEFLNSTRKNGSFKEQSLVYWCSMPMSEVISSL